MKLKLFILALFILLSLVAYQKYSEYSVHKSINSYDSCVNKNGIVVQITYPRICIASKRDYFFDPHSDPSIAFNSSVDWEEHKFTRAGFSFMTPSSWTVYPKNSESTNLVDGSMIIMGPKHILENIDPDDGSALGGFKVGIKGYVGGNGFLNERPFYENNLESKGKLTIDTIEYTKVLVDHKVAILARRTTDAGYGIGIYSEVYIPLSQNNGLILMVENTAIDSVLIQILSTFKFTD